MVLLVVGHLLLPPILRHGQELLDALRHHVGVENDFAVQVARGAARGLDQARLALRK